jgi:ferredoxin
MQIEVDAAKCTGCGCCILVCPEDAIDNVPSFIARIEPGLCTECLACLDACPNQALEVGEWRG